MRHRLHTRAVAVAATLAVSLVTHRAAAQDTVRVRADNAPVWGTNSTLTQVFALGDIDGPPEYAFGSVDQFATRSDGSFVVYDGQDRQIRLYSASGKFVRTVGRSGAGPGEYNRVLGMGTLPGDTLVTWDAGQRRLSFFAPDGSFARSVALDFGDNTDAPFGVDAQGRIYVKTRIASPPPPAEARYGYVRVNSRGTVLDTVRIPARDAAIGFVVELTTEGYRWNFMPSTVTAVYPLGGVVSGRTERYAITLDIGGKPTIVEHAYTPVPVRPEERAEWEAFVSDYDRIARKGAPPPATRLPIPETKPPFRGITADVDGRIWVEVYTTATKRPPVTYEGNATMHAQVTWRESATFDVFGPDARFFGRVALPRNSVMLAARGDRLWVRTVGAHDEHRIVSYRIGGAAR